MLGLARGFSPDMLPGLVFWADGSRYSAVDGTAEGTASNLAPTGSANDATQSTGAQQPLFKMGGNGINSRGVLRFDGINDLLRCPVDVHGASTTFVVFRVRALPGASSFENLTSFKSVSSGNIFDEILLCNFSGIQPYSWRTDYQASGNAVGIADALDTNPHVIAVSYDGSGSNTLPASYTCNLDGTAKTVIASGAFARTSTDLGSLACRADSGGGAALAALNGDIGEVLRYNRQLSAYEQAIVVKYLRNKWGI